MGLSSVHASALQRSSRAPPASLCTYGRAHWQGLEKYQQSTLSCSLFLNLVLSPSLPLPPSLSLSLTVSLCVCLCLSFVSLSLAARDCAATASSRTLTICENDQHGACRVVLYCNKAYKSLLTHSFFLFMQTMDHIVALVSHLI